MYDNNKMKVISWFETFMSSGGCNDKKLIGYDLDLVFDPMLNRNI